MYIQKVTLILTALLMTSGAVTNVAAQDQNTLDISTQNAEIEPVKRYRIKREVQPISYWIDAPSLRVRDNPVAGNIVGSLDHGQKIYAYSQYENWVRISKPGTKERWINSDFLSNSRISWASFNRNTPKRSSDVVAVRVKDPSDSKARVFAVRLKTADTGNAIITTREATSQGVFYQNHFVSCDNELAVGARLIGEGTNFLAAQNDFRNYALDIYTSEPINDDVRPGIDSAISNFACKSNAF